MDFRQVAIIDGKRAAGWAKAVSYDLQQALEHHGVPAHLVDLDALAEFCTAGIGKSEQTIFIDFNHRVVFPWERPMVALMLDHPCSLVSELGAPRSEIAITGWVDATHPVAVKTLGFNHRCFFMPHAGPPSDQAMVPFEERDIDVFFAGSLAEPIARDAWCEHRADVPAAIAAALFDAAEQVETGTPVLVALFDAMSHHKVSPSQFAREAFSDLVSFVLRTAEINRRVSVLSHLPGDLRVAVAADYFPAALRDRPNVQYLGYIENFAEIRSLMRNARIVLNTTAKFPAGSHERIWYAMAAGTVVLTDSSSFMAQDFSDGENIFYLPQKRIAERDLTPLVEIARDGSKLAGIAGRATETYQSRHSWMKRAPLLMAAMEAA